MASSDNLNLSEILLYQTDDGSTRIDVRCRMILYG